MDKAVYTIYRNKINNYTVEFKETVGKPIRYQFAKFSHIVLDLLNNEAPPWNRGQFIPSPRPFFENEQYTIFKFSPSNQEDKTQTWSEKKFYWSHQDQVFDTPKSLGEVLEEIQQKMRLEK